MKYSAPSVSGLGGPGFSQEKIGRGGGRVAMV